ncbi:hypothetical protein MMC30_000993 [Trapelia coarctata]|nr:hypothetical protein [Trapelia coarctata]
MAPSRRKSVMFTRQKSEQPTVMLDSPPAAGLYPSSIPHSLQAIVTTTRGVYSWTVDGVKEIFHSGSGGIVAAKKTGGAGGLLAVADSQVVVLHDIKKGMQQSYRLKGTEGHIRMLRYLRDSELLLFTTSLQYAVQSYSLSKAELLGPAHTHPSPPTVLAVSPSSHILLSSSAVPPTVYLQFLNSADPPLLLQPDSSSATVLAAAFHPERPTIFALAFGDGTLSVFNAMYLLRGKGRSRHSGEISSVKKLHAAAAEEGTCNEERKPLFRGFDQATGAVSVGEHAASIISVAFVPGTECTTISVGADGKCCLVEFTLKGPVVRSWDVGGASTSLSVIRSCPHDQSLQLDGAESTDAYHKILAAIGRRDGCVRLFDLNGKSIASRSFDTKGPVLDVEFLETPENTDGNDKKPEQTISNPQSRATTEHPTRPVPQSLKSAFAEAYALAASVDAKSECLSAKPSHSHNSSTDSSLSFPKPPYFTETKQKNTAQQSEPQSPSARPPPQIPPRPTPRKGGKLAMRHAETAVRSAAGPEQMEPLRSRRKTTDILCIQSPDLQALGGDATSFISREVAPSEEAQPTHAATIATSSPKTANPSTRPARKISSIPARLGSRNQSTTSQDLSASITTTEASADTIIDWAPASQKRISVYASKPSAALKKQRSAYALATPASRAQAPTGTQSIASDDTIIEWHPPSSGFNILEDPVGENEAGEGETGRRASAVKRKGSSVVSPLGNGSLNPSVRTKSGSKGAPKSMAVSRRASRLLFRPAPVGEEGKVAGKREGEAVGVSDEGAVSCGMGITVPDMQAMQALFREEMANLEKKLARQFERQREWFVGFMAEREEWARKLEEENGMLRERLSRERERNIGS